MNDTVKAELAKLLAGANVDKSVIDGLIAQIIVLLMMTPEAEPAAVATEEIMPAAANANATPGATPAATPAAAQQSLAAARDANAALNRRLTTVEAELAQRSRRRSQQATPGT